MKAITLFILLSLPVFILAQDHLYFTDGSVHTTKILEITPEVVKYKRFDFQDGPTYTIKRDDIQKIEYSNGRVEWYTEPPVEIEPPMLDDEEQEFEEEAREEEREDDLEEKEQEEEEKDDFEEEKQRESEEEVRVVEPEAENMRIEMQEAAFKKGFFVGLIAGGNVNAALYDYQTAPEPPLGFAFGPSAGIAIDWRMARSFSLQSVLAYRVKGNRIDVAEWVTSLEDAYPYDPIILFPAIEADGYLKTSIHYLEWSLCPVFHVDILQLGFGGYLAAGLSGKETADYEISYYLEGELFDQDIVNTTRDVAFVDLISAGDESALYINRMDYGLTGYMGFAIDPLTIGMTFNYGLNQWEPENNLFSSSKPPNETRHITGMLSLAYYFGK
jgi:hypothetical protein